MVGDKGCSSGFYHFFARLLVLEPKSRKQDARAGEKDTVNMLASHSSFLFKATQSTHQRAIQIPQITFVSKQLPLVAPAQTQRPHFPPLFTLATKLLNQLAALAAETSSETLAMEEQLSKLRGLPRVTETTIKARRSKESMPAMMKRPRFAEERKKGMEIRV